MRYGRNIHLKDPHVGQSVNRWLQTRIFNLQYLAKDFKNALPRQIVENRPIPEKTINNLGRYMSHLSNGSEHIAATLVDLILRASWQLDGGHLAPAGHDAQQEEGGKREEKGETGHHR